LFLSLLHAFNLQTSLFQKICFRKSHFLLTFSSRREEKKRKRISSQYSGLRPTYNKVNDYTKGALGELLQSVPGGKTTLAAVSKALKFYNQHISPRNASVTTDIQDLGDRVGAYRL